MKRDVSLALVDQFDHSPFHWFKHQETQVKGLDKSHFPQKQNYHLSNKLVAELQQDNETSKFEVMHGDTSAIYESIEWVAHKLV